MGWGGGYCVWVGLESEIDMNTRTPGFPLEDYTAAMISVIHLFVGLMLWLMGV